MPESRSVNTKRNIVSGFILKTITMILPFVIRTAILYCLGEEYVGISSLFTSILQVLNLAELGFSNAIVYNMYRPIAENDDVKVCALLNFYRKVYLAIGSIILVVGIIIMPFIPKMIKGTWPSEVNIYFLYFLYLLNSAVSYFAFAYKSALLNALQRMDLSNIIITVVYIGKYLVQLFVLIAFKSIYLYVITAIIASIVNNIVTGVVSEKKYPQYSAKGNLPKDEIKNIKKHVGGLMICKISDTTRNSFDSIVLSALFGLTVVAMYSNYYYVFSSVYGILLIVTQGMQASVGNCIATESTEKNYEDMRKFQFIFSWLAGWCTICMLCLYQPFMMVWTGKALVLPEKDMILFCVYFYVLNLNNMRNLYFTGNGLWWAGKKSFIYESLANLLLNLLLGRLLGVTGILLATIMTVLVYNFVARTNILFKQYFKFSPKEFYVDAIKHALLTCVVGMISFFCTNSISGASIMQLVLGAIVCLIVPNLLYALLYRKDPIFAEACNFILSV